MQESGRILVIARRSQARREPAAGCTRRAPRPIVPSVPAPVPDPPDWIIFSATGCRSVAIGFGLRRAEIENELDLAPLHPHPRYRSILELTN